MGWTGESDVESVQPVRPESAQGRLPEHHQAVRFVMKKHTLAEVPEQFRAKIVSSDPEGNELVWVEGPYPKESVARGRITFWKNHYAQDPGREGWRIHGVVQASTMTWRNI